MRAGITIVIANKIDIKSYIIKWDKEAWHRWLNACYPSYSGGRDQEDHGSKPAQVNSVWDTVSKSPSQKRAGEVAQSV
jgi:hypothetical protein